MRPDNRPHVKRTHPVDHRRIRAAQRDMKRWVAPA